MDVKLTPAQALAYDQLLPFLEGETDAHLAVLEGYAGTGKTFLVAQLLAALPRLKIAVAAPTNKAVRVLRDKLLDAGVAVASSGDPDWTERRHHPIEGCTCRSVHALLGLKLHETDDGQQEFTADGSATLRDYDAVVVDECSMLSQALFQKIVLERGPAQILFVGDPAQLPPVKEAEISPVFRLVNLKVRLVEVVRQARDNPIIRLSMRLRELIEAGMKASALDLIEALPDLTTRPKAGLVRGTSKDLVDWWLSQTQEDAPGSDVRIIAYTNRRVERYNQAIHQALYGETATRFVAGERVIVHTQCEAQRLTPGSGSWRLSEPDRLITSEELQVEAVEIKPHPLFPEIPGVEALTLCNDAGYRYVVFVTQNEAFLERQITEGFARMKMLRFQSARADDQQRRVLQNEAMEARDRAVGLKKAFAKLRHAYAITCHKSQGSTFDCALVDFTDLAKMQNAFEFNRALYVAATRSREYLALVVT